MSSEDKTHLFLQCCVIVVNIFVGGWCVTKVWEWHIVPITALDPISLKHGIGLMCFIGLFNTHLCTGAERLPQPVERTARMALTVAAMLLGTVVAWMAS